MPTIEYSVNTIDRIWEWWVNILQRLPHLTSPNFPYNFSWSRGVELKIFGHRGIKHACRNTVVRIFQHRHFNVFYVEERLRHLFYFRLKELESHPALQVESLSVEI